MALPTAKPSLPLDLGELAEQAPVHKRQLAVIIGPQPTSTAASLSSALVAAQASAAVLQQQLQQQSLSAQQLLQQQSLSVQQLQAASMSALASVVSLQNAIASVSNSAKLAVASASSSADLAVASVSNSAAVAIAGLSNSLTNANVRASSAAIAAMAQADTRVSVVQETTFNVGQITAAVIVSIVGSVILTSFCFLFIMARRQRDRRRILDLKASIKRPATRTSFGSTVSAWTTRFQQRAPDEKPPELEEPRARGTESPDLADGINDALHLGKEEEQRRPDWPLSLDSPEHQPHARTTSDGQSATVFSIFPKVAQEKTGV